MKYIEKIQQRLEVTKKDTVSSIFMIEVLNEIKEKLDKAIYPIEECYDVKLAMDRLKDLQQMLDTRK